MSKDQQTGESMSKKTTLEQCRKQWEKGLHVAAEHKRDEWTFLVILRNAKNEYHCHRYFTVGGDWTVSVDACDVNAETAMKWAMNPKALPRE